MSGTYQIKLAQFEGPFDLLLFFIERDELDIYNIPIHSLIKDFLNFIHGEEILDIDLSSEFILFVSTLMRIKAKMLLPRRELDAQGNEIDPRQELVDKILEYRRFKEASEEMVRLEAERLLVARRGNIRADMAGVSDVHSEGTEIQTVSLYKLMQTFEKVMRRYNDRINKPQHVVVKYNWTMEGQRSYLLEKVGAEKRMAFESLFADCSGRIHAIFTFLSMLELIQQRYISLLTGTGRNNFILEWVEDREQMLSEESATPAAG